MQSNVAVMGSFKYISSLLPELGQWYKNRDTGELFEVVALDEADSNVEIQYFDGEIAGFDNLTWNQLYLIPVAAPEDYSGAYDFVKEDLYYSDEPFRPQDWSGPLIDLEAFDQVVEFDDW